MSCSLSCNVGSFLHLAAIEETLQTRQLVQINIRTANTAVIISLNTEFGHFIKMHDGQWLILDKTSSHVFIHLICWWILHLMLLTKSMSFDVMCIPEHILICTNTLLYWIIRWYVCLAYSGQACSFIGWMFSACDISSYILMGRCQQRKGTTYSLVQFWWKNNYNSTADKEKTTRRIITRSFSTWCSKHSFNINP